jgi:chromosome transmission fidelity protein 18
MSSYSQDVPSSFDLALLHSELQELPEDLPSTSYSDDIDALQQCITEDIAEKTSKGVVIQHRAWTLAEVFRSEGELSIGTASVATRRGWN